MEEDTQPVLPAGDRRRRRQVRQHLRDHGCEQGVAGRDMPIDRGGIDAQDTRQVPDRKTVQTALVEQGDGSGHDPVPCQDTIFRGARPAAPTRGVWGRCHTKLIATADTASTVLICNVPRDTGLSLPARASTTQPSSLPLSTRSGRRPARLRRPGSTCREMTLAADLVLSSAAPRPSMVSGRATSTGPELATSSSLAPYHTVEGFPAQIIRRGSVGRATGPHWSRKRERPALSLLLADVLP